MTRPVILFVVGAPGVGKTTIVRGLLGGQLLFTEPPEPKWTVADNGQTTAAGWYKGETFDGGDTVPYTGAKEALAFWSTELWKLGPVLTIFDGARFTTGPALAYVTGFAEEVDAQVIGVHLIARTDQLAARRTARGSHQSPTWIKGATTSAANFARKIGALEICTDDLADACEAVRTAIENASCTE